MSNDFTGDSNCVALWRFEPTDLLADSISTNDLTDNNTIGSNTADHIEGAGCADFEQLNYEHGNILDTNLSAGFPFKSGDTNKKITVCGRLKFETVNAAQYIFCKGENVTNKRSFAIYNNSNKLGILLGYSGGASFEGAYLTSSLLTGRFYSYGATYDDSDKSYRLRVWDHTAGALFQEITGNFTNNVNVEDGALFIGSRDGGSVSFDGLMDETVVFKDIKTADIIDQIRAGTYGGGDAAVAFFDGKIRIVSASSILLDGLLKIKDDAINLLDGKVALSEQTPITNLLDGKLAVKDTTIALLDGSLAVQNSATLLLNGLATVSNVGQSTLDGKLVLKSAGTSLFDGKATIRDIALNYLDGKAQIKNTASDLLNGKIAVLSNVTNSLDGKMLLESGGTVYDLLDGKISIKSVTTDYLDGLISIQDYSTLSLDGKLIIFKNSALNLDGKVTVKDIASDLLDGKIAIKTNVVNLFDGNLSVKTASIGLLDGKIIIGDDGTTILDGKLVIASDSATNVFDGKIILTALAHGKVTVTFDLKTPGISFDLKTPGITFSIV